MTNTYLQFKNQLFNKISEVFDSSFNELHFTKKGDLSKYDYGCSIRYEKSNRYVTFDTSFFATDYPYDLNVILAKKGFIFSKEVPLWFIQFSKTGKYNTYSLTENSQTLNSFLPADRLQEILIKMKTDLFLFGSDFLINSEPQFSIMYRDYKKYRIELQNKYSAKPAT